MLPNMSVPKSTMRAFLIHIHKLSDSCLPTTRGEKTLNGFPIDGNGSVKLKRIHS